MKGLIGRLRLIYFFLIDNKCRKRTTIKELFLHFFMKKCEKITSKFVFKVRASESYTEYKIKGFDEVFKYPASVPYHNFAQVISEGMQKNHWHYYEIDETSVATGDIIVDCGSAEGFFAFKHQHAAKKIYLIEPLPVFCDSLIMNFRSNPKIDIINVALSDKIGEATLLINDSSPIASKISLDENLVGGKKIKLETIDSLFVDRGLKINYLKADLEGFEEKMITGAIRTIVDSKPKIAITTYHKNQDAEKLLKLILSKVPEYNYKFKGIESIKGNPVMLHMWV